MSEQYNFDHRMYKCIQLYSHHLMGVEVSKQFVKIVKQERNAFDFSNEIEKNIRGDSQKTSAVERYVTKRPSKN